MVDRKKSIWKAKLRRFERWRAGKRPKLLVSYWDFLMTEFIKEIPVDMGRNLLDIGCGGGGCLCSVVKEKIYTGIGLDPIVGSSLKVLQKRARREKIPVHAIRGVGENLPLKDSCIHVVIMRATLDHVADPRSVMREVHRLLCEDGFVIIQHGIRGRKTNPDNLHLRVLTLNYLHNLLIANSFMIIRARLLNRLFNICPLPQFLLRIILRLNMPLHIESQICARKAQNG